jgi:hypothetical protein
MGSSCPIEHQAGLTAHSSSLNRAAAPTRASTGLVATHAVDVNAITWCECTITHRNAA